MERNSARAQCAGVRAKPETAENGDNGEDTSPIFFPVSPALPILRFVLKVPVSLLLLPSFPHLRTIPNGGFFAIAHNRCARTTGRPKVRLRSRTPSKASASPFSIKRGPVRLSVLPGAPTPRPRRFSFRQSFFFQIDKLKANTPLLEEPLRLPGLGAFL